MERVSKDFVSNQIQYHRDPKEDNSSDLHRPRTLLFFINGDRFFRGKKVHVSPSQQYDLNDFLTDLAGELQPSASLPYGARQIFTPVGGRKIIDIEQMKDGETYVVAGFEGFKPIKYGRGRLESWAMTRSDHKPDINPATGNNESYKYRGYAHNAFHPGRYFRINQSNHRRRWAGPFWANRQERSQKTQKPKVITVIRNGSKPRRSVKVLLNPHVVQSYEQLVNDISGAFGPKQKSNEIKRLFTIRGREVLGISDFFRGDDCFIAQCGREANLTRAEVMDILQEFFSDLHVVNSLLAEWHKSQRRRGNVNPAGKSLITKKDVNMAGDDQENRVHESRVQEKRDSGFISDDMSTNWAQEDYSRRRHDCGRRKNLRNMINGEMEGKIESHTCKQSGIVSLDERPHQQEHAIMSDEEKDKEEREMVTEAEKRMINDEMRKDDETVCKHVSERKDGGRVEEQRKETERPHVDRSLREATEKAARERMALAEKAEREKREKKRLGVEMMEKSNVKKEGKSLLDLKMQNKENIEERSFGQENVVQRLSDGALTHRTSEQAKKTAEREQKVRFAEKVASTTKIKPEVVPTTQHTIGHHDREVRTSNGQLKEKRKQDRDEIRQRKQGRDEVRQRKRQKTRAIHKSKEERLVSSDEYILAHFDLGRILGDGNFAVVRHSLEKETGHEFAIKVIDKTKLKGKEYMVENEIDIMKDCRHDNIVRLYEEYETPDRIYLLMEIVKGGDLFDAITQSVRFDEKMSALMVRDMCSALFYLHSRRIVHRDLKPENLLVERHKDGRITLKLADFGLAMEVQGLIYTVCGTPTYVAPEILAETGYSLEVDMWAVGVIMYIMLCGFPPFRSADRKQTELFALIKAGIFEFLSPFWDHVTTSAKHLICQLLVVERNKRYTATDVLCHKWILSNGQPGLVAPDVAAAADSADAQTRQMLEEQARVNYVSYQRLKEKKRRRRNKGQE